MEDEAPFSLSSAWAHLGDLIAMMIALFGAPASIAARLLLLRANRQDILRWLAPLEALARRLLVLEAAQLAPRNDAACPYPAARIASLMRDAPTTPMSENSAEWRVIFNVWPVARRIGARTSTSMRNAHAPSFNAVALAKRIEALSRLAQDRAACIARMARRLAQHRESAAHAFAPYRPPAGPVHTMLLQTQAQVEAALANTS